MRRYNAHTPVHTRTHVHTHQHTHKHTQTYTHAHTHTHTHVGIGPSAAALCALEVLDACGPSITEAVYFGTSGWSPALGGILNPPHCSAAHATDKITR